MRTVGSLFYGLFNAPPEPSIQKKRLWVAPADYARMNDYLCQAKFLEDGYSDVVLNCFDFASTSRYAALFDALSPYFILAKATLTLDQLTRLLEREYDLSRADYHVPSILSLQDYLVLFYKSANHNLPMGLHGVRVNFTYADVQNCREDFISACQPMSLDNAILSQPQFNAAIERKNYRHPLNLTRILLNHLVLSDVIKHANERVTFNEYDLFANPTNLYLAQTSIQQAVLDVEALAICARFSKYYPWFEAKHLTFKLHREDGLEDLCYTLACDDFFVKMDTPGIQMRLNEYIKNEMGVKKENHEKTPSEKMLWFAHCAFHKPESMLTEFFWKTVVAVNARAATPDTTVLPYNEVYFSP